MKSLKELFITHDGRESQKFEHDLDIYDDLFFKYRDKAITVLEIGIGKGGFLEILSNYFLNGKIYGLDYKLFNYEYKQSNIIKVFYGLQEDEKILNELINECGGFDIIIDDAGHDSAAQIITFEKLFPHLREGGFYCCEDTHMSYHPHYIKTSFIEYLFRLVDRLNTNNENFEVYFYPYLAIVEKTKLNLHSPIFAAKKHA